MSGGLADAGARAQIREAIVAADPKATVIDPLKLRADRAAKLYPPGTTPADSFTDDAHVRMLMADVLAAAASADVVVAYLPSPDMQCAVELHTARAGGKNVLVIAPQADDMSGASMQADWTVRGYSDKVFTSVAEFGDYLDEQQEGKGWSGARRE